MLLGVSRGRDGKCLDEPTEFADVLCDLFVSKML